MGNIESNRNAQPLRRGIAIVIATVVTTLALGVTVASWAGYVVRPVPEVQQVPEVQPPPQPTAPPPAPARGQPPRDPAGTQVVLVPVERNVDPSSAAPAALDPQGESSALWAAAEGEEREHDEGHHHRRHHEEREGEDDDD